eukprot:m.179720 g.179720  ORF g.179720 m.179720 type:complete len:402 (-) comp14838_c0_seq1:251-1456(-)
MGQHFSTGRKSQLERWLEQGVELKHPHKALRVLRLNGVTTLTELMLLCEPERDELVGAMQRAGIVLGDRSKIRRADPESIGEFMKRIEKEESSSERVSPALSSPTKRMSRTPASTTSEDVNTGLTPPPARQTSRKIRGAPAWWKEHDKKIINLAKAASKRPSDGGEVTYEWQEMRSHGWEKYQRALWLRRSEMLDHGMFTRDAALKAEWLALVLEIDRTLDGKDAGDIVPVKADYVWYERRNEPTYVNALLERRTEMLRLDLTQTPTLQAEWVLLMRELEFTLSPAGNRLRIPSASLDDSGIIEASDTTPVSAPEGQSLLLDNIEAWRKDIETATGGRPLSVCSQMTDNSVLDRAASLASFYSATHGEHQSDHEDFFSDCGDLVSNTAESHQQACEIPSAV